MSTPIAFSQGLADSLTKISLTDFFHAIQSQFYPTQDISFMDFFLELTEHENEFCVHHDKLVEYGVMTSDRSSAMKGKLDQLELVEGVDYTLQDILQRGSSGAQISKVYHLTPSAFKLCLMRARRYTGQATDPVVYVQYYILLEKVFKLFTDYEKAYLSKLNSMKDDKIDKLQSTVDQQSAKIDEQTSRIDKLLGYAEDTCEKLEITNTQLDEVKVQNDVLIEKADALAEGQQVLYRKAVEIQRMVPAKQSNPDREPCIAMTYVLYNHDTNGPTIRMFPHVGQYKTLTAKLVKMMNGDYKTNSNLIVRARHQIAFPPMYAPDQRNWITSAQALFKLKIANRLASAKATRKSGISSANGTIKSLTNPNASIPVKSTHGVQNIAVLEHLILREQSLLDASNDDDSKLRHGKKLAALERRLIASNDKLAVIRLRLEDLKSTKIESPVTFNKTHIDYKSSEYCSIHDIIEIFEQLMIDTHGAVYLKSMTHDLLNIAASSQQDFISDRNEFKSDEMESLRAAANTAFEESTRRICGAMTEFVLADTDADDDQIMERLINAYAS
jgi:hypothetical protein